MPGGNFRDESLEARIERIRERDEEIEKKHREAEADRLAALQANAMVRTTAPKDEDWPKAHKYDKLDFTYDVKVDDADESNKKAGSVLSRNYKKFPEGQGPPADPTYNFLADAERDGIAKNSSNSGESDKKDWRAACTGGHLNRRGNNNNNSFNKGRNNGKGKNSTGSGKFQQRNAGADGEYTSWKNERERIDESRVNRQKSDEGKWRREWDSEKSAQDANNQSKANAGSVVLRAPNAPINNTRNLPAEAVPNEVNNEVKADVAQLANILPQKFNELNIEKRGNITVSISQDGEVKSVKCEYLMQSNFLWPFLILDFVFPVDATRAIGTGRVGNGMTLRQNSQPQHSAESNNSFDAAVAAGRRYEQTLNQTAYVPSQQTGVNNAIQTNNVKRKSVQDRLVRSRAYFDESAPNFNQ